MDDELVSGCIRVTSPSEDSTLYGKSLTDLDSLIQSYLDNGYTETIIVSSDSERHSELDNGSSVTEIKWELYRYLTGKNLPEFFREKPLPSILVSLLDSSLKRDVQGTIDILESGGLITSDGIGNIRLKEYGASELAQISLLSSDVVGGGLTQDDLDERRANRLLAISKLSESFSKIKGQKKAIQLILRLLGMTGEIIEYDDERRGTAPFNQNLQPGEVVVIGGIDPTIGADLLSENPNKTAEAILEELIDLFAWAHMRFAGILVAEQFLVEFDNFPVANLGNVCIIHSATASYCPQITLPLYSYHPVTNALISTAGSTVSVDKFTTGLMKHKVFIGPYGCTDVDGNLQNQVNIGDAGITVGGDYSCDLKNMNGLSIDLFHPIGFYECPNGQQWNIGDPGFLVGGYCETPVCFGSTLETIVT